MIGRELHNLRMRAVQGDGAARASFERRFAPVLARIVRRHLRPSSGCNVVQQLIAEETPKAKQLHGNHPAAVEETVVDTVVNRLSEILLLQPELSQKIGWPSMVDRAAEQRKPQQSDDYPDRLATRRDWPSWKDTFATA